MNGLFAITSGCASAEITLSYRLQPLRNQSNLKNWTLGIFLGIF